MYNTCNNIFSYSVVVTVTIRQFVVSIDKTSNEEIFYVQTVNHYRGYQSAT